MKQITSYLVAAALLIAPITTFAQKSITIKGQVQFTEPDFQITVFQWSGSDKIVKASTSINKDNTYSLTLPVEEAGVYTVDCARWQSVSVWGDDEDISINFRGKDTAKVIIKNPPFVGIKGGKKNEVMNLVNFESHRHYQNLIAISGATYGTVTDTKERGEITTQLYEINDNNYYSHIEFLARTYSSIPSTLYILDILSKSKYDALREEVLRDMERANPGYAPIVTYRKQREKALNGKKRCEVGSIAPQFEYKTFDGKRVVGPSTFKGKVLLIDFWASWCGPCRGEIPNLKTIYEKYKGKDVEFLSVSIDSKNNKWREAVAQEKMPWEQICTDDAGKKVMELYQFTGIPFIILIDKDGKIAAKNIRGERIEEEIEKLIK